jgi:hypothetical protein
MKIWLTGAALGASCLALVSGAAQRPGRPDAARTGWLTSFEAGRTLARQTGKPLFVVFRCEA